MAYYNVICSCCGEVNSVESKANKAFCSKCGAPLFIEKPILPNIKHNNSQHYVDYYSKGKEYLKKEDFRNLGLLANKMLVIFPDKFFSYAFKAMAEIGIDLSKSISLAPIILNVSEIEIDMKSRMYHFARIKYQNAQKYKKDTLEKYYPDEKDIYTNKMRRKRTSYDVVNERLIDLSLRGRKSKDYYIAMMNAFSVNEEEKKIINNYINWWKYLDDSLNEMTRYDETANKFISDEFVKTPQVGNPVTYGLLITTCVLSIICALFSIIEILFMGLNNMKNISAFGVVVAVIISIIFLLVTVFALWKAPILNKKRHTLAKVLIFVSVAGLSAAGISTCLVSYQSQSENIFGVWYFVVGIVCGIFLAICAALQFNKHKNHKVTNINTIFSDYKSLSKNSVDIPFKFTFKKVTNNKLVRVKLP